MVCPHAACDNGKFALITAGLLIGSATIACLFCQKLAKKARCDHQDKINTDEDDIEDVGEEKRHCRCGKSKNLPFCDGSHATHDKESGDNVEPLKKES